LAAGRALRHDGFLEKKSGSAVAALWPPGRLAATSSRRDRNLRVRLGGREARIQAIAPDLQLPARLRKPNPIFARGELRRLTIDMLREAGRGSDCGGIC